MTQWLTENWYIVFAFGGVVALVAYRMNRDQAEGSFLRRVALALFPVLGPDGAKRSGLTPRALWLFAFGLVVLLLAFLFVPTS